MTVSDVYMDPKTRNKRMPDYCYVVKRGKYVQVHRFSTREAAQAARAQELKHA